MTRPLIFIANFKMNLSYIQEVAYFAKNLTHMTRLIANPKQQLIFCPSFLSLATISPLISSTPIQLGAQDCSAHTSGAYTGQVQARALHEAGCRFGIIGHSETRNSHALSDESVAQKAIMLLSANISPIFCIGERPGENAEQKIALQLAPFFRLLNQIKSAYSPEVLIAYEPLSAIGTGKTPTAKQLTAIFYFLNELALRECPQLSPKLIYGGSVNSKNIKELSKIPHINGFLVGNGSLEFQEFEKIVEQG